MLAGCSTIQSPAPTNSATATAPYRSALLSVQYGDEAVKQALADQGLTSAFQDYWGAYADRNWAARYRMEEFQKEVTAPFYLAYHQAAWTLLELKVESIDISDAPNRVRLGLQAKFRNPERAEQERSVVLTDLWSKRDNGWVHINSDPMLNGLRAVQ